MLTYLDSFFVISERIVVPSLVVAGAILIFIVIVSALAFFARHSGYDLDAPIAFVLVILSVAVVGSGAGYVGGLSRVGAVGDIIAGVMGVFAAGAVYFLDSSRTRGVIVALNATAFAVAMVIGFRVGAETRSQNEAFNKWRDACLEHYTADQVQSLKDSNDTAIAFVDQTCKLVLGASRQQLIP